MPRVRIELTQGNPHGFLRPTRLPIPPPRQQLSHILAVSLAFFHKIKHSKDREKSMNYIQEVAASLFSVTSVWSVIFRAFLWIVIAVIILVATDHPHPEQGAKNLKNYLGFFLLFIFVSTSMIFLLFGVTSV